jgi:hypothetical protein
MVQPREVLTWPDFDTSVCPLAERIASDGVPDMILSIAFPWSDRPPVTGRGVSDS